MERIDHALEIARQYHHMPILLSLFVGLLVIKKRPWLFFNEGEIAGDNIPASLIDGLGV